MSEPGCVFYRGPSLLTGEPIVGVATGLDGGSMNPKTGAMVQTWVIRTDQRPMDAIRAGVDDAVCGDCALRGRGGRNRRCYVVPWLGPANVYRHVRSQRYHEASWPDVRALVEGRHVRICAYGDPAAVPFEVWRQVIAGAAGWTAYTHGWRTCDRRLQSIAMASVETLAQMQDARRAGWRTFRLRPLAGDDLVDGVEVVCPASEEAGYRTTCLTCELCRGNDRQARSVAIRPHGNTGTMAAFHRTRELAEGSR